MLRSGEQTAEQTQHTAMRHHENASTRVEVGDVGERGHGARLGGIGRLESGRTAIGFEPAGPLRLDLLARQALPLTGVVLAPTGVDSARRTAHDFGEQVGGDGGPFEVARDHQVERRTLRCEKTTGLTRLEASESRQRGIGLSLPLAESVPLALTVAHDQDSSDDARAGAGHGRPRYPRYAHDVVTVRLFAQAREAAGTSRDVLPGTTVDEVVRQACDKYGERFASLLPTCRIWLNGEEVPPSTAVGDHDEVAVLPPVSGGCR